MLQDIILLQTGVVFLKVKENKEISIDQLTTLQVVNSGFVSVFVNDLEIASGQNITLVPADNTLSKVDLSICFAEVDTGAEKEFSKFSWNKKELTIIYKKLIRCKN
jgi:hypothetical protein